MFGDQTWSKIVCWWNHFPFGHLVWLYLIKHVWYHLATQYNINIFNHQTMVDRVRSPNVSRLDRALQMITRGPLHITKNNEFFLNVLNRNWGRPPSCSWVISHKNKWIPGNCIGYLCPLAMFKVLKMLCKTHEVLTMSWSSLNPTPAQPAFPLSSNSTLSFIFWYVTKKSQSSLDEQESGILKLPCAGAVVVGS